MRFRPTAVALLLTAAPHAIAVAQRAPLTVAQWREDLHVLATEVPRRHKNAFHAISRTAFDSAVRDLDTRIPSLQRDEIIVGMMRIVALVGDGHTNIYPTRDSVIGFHALPVQLYLFRDGLYVRAARSEQAGLVGARVVGIGGVDVDETYRRARALVGRDNEQGARFWVPHLLACAEVLHALGLAPTADSARVEIEQDGRRRSVWLVPAGLVEMMAGDTDKSWRHRTGWVDARDAATRSGTPEPLWLAASPDTTFRMTYLPAGRALYVQLNQVKAGPGEEFGDYARRLGAAIDRAPADRPVERMILDLRLNRGGDGTLLTPLVTTLVKSRIDTTGRLMVLIGRGTFSAAEFLVDHLERWTNAVFVGEPTSSKGKVYGDSRRFTLPNSGVSVRASVYYWQMWQPWDAREWTPPRVAAEPTMADYRANRDPALDAALAYHTEPVALATRLTPFFEAGDTTAAIATLRAYRARPENAYAATYTAIDTIAGVLLSKGQTAAAVHAGELWVREHPGESQAYAILGELYVRAGRESDARNAFARAVALAPGNDFARERYNALSGPR